jgi:hypothetical protein
VRAKIPFGNPMAAECAAIEVHVTEPAQLLNSIDPSPFGERDLAPNVEEYIVSRSKDFPRAASLGLVIDLDSPVRDHESAALRNAIRRHFGERAEATRARLSELFSRGRISLIIGLAFLSLALGASHVLEKWLDPGGMLDVLRASLSIGGWVAMWRPMEVFLYDWWPIRAEVRLYDRLAAMPVRIRHAAAASDA